MRMMDIAVDFLKKSFLSVKLTSQFACEFALNVTLDIAVFYAGTFIVHFFTFTDSKCNFYTTVFKVKIQWNQCASFSFHTADNLIVPLTMPLRKVSFATTL